MKSTILIILFTIATVPSYSQPDVRLEITSGVAFVLPTNTLLTDWENGWRVGAAMIQGLSPTIQLQASFGYSCHRYSGDPEGKVFNPSLSIKADVTEIYDASLGIRYLAAPSPIQPFLSFRGGFLATHVGQIRTVTPQNNWSYLTYDQSQTITGKGFIAGGIGWTIEIGSSTHFMVEVTFVNTFDSPQQYFPIVAGLQMNIR